ncbi:hypothetical protein [Rubinisphaera margarita]|uniref:hypothetical protein n=1 Tax=Rubinisphaera margarita TaxID=2909586 RepID=UPI001EE97434|nr:hypothetical protein [Rubinisphaera margarita]MCG6156326.1 hypothetical protein [Rubinisphaera margarita]
MRQSELNRAVASATGESIATIKRLGFLLSDPDTASRPERDCEPAMLDWDDCLIADDDVLADIAPESLVA